MRRHGYTHVPDALGLNGHACWTFEDVGDFVVAAAPFLEEGLALGQRLMFVGGSEAEDAIRRVEPMRTMLEEGLLGIAPFEAVYPGGRRMPNEEQWAMYAAATDEAIAAGHTGLRVLAEVTALVLPPKEVCGQARWESFADRHMAATPLAALCCFNRHSVAEPDLAALASVHPMVDGRLERSAPFTMHAQPGGVLALTGQVDAYSSDAFARVLTLVADGSEKQVGLDLAEIDFVDHRGLVVLAEHLRALTEQGVTVSLRDESPGSQRLSELLAQDD